MKGELVSVSRMPLERAASLTTDVVIVLVTVHAGVVCGRFSIKSENDSLAKVLKSKELTLRRLRLIFSVIVSLILFSSDKTSFLKIAISSNTLSTCVLTVLTSSLSSVIVLFDTSVSFPIIFKTEVPVFWVCKPLSALTCKMFPLTMLSTFAGFFTFSNCSGLLYNFCFSFGCGLLLFGFWGCGNC